MVLKALTARKVQLVPSVYVEALLPQDKLVSICYSHLSILALSGLTLAGSSPLPKVRP
jgi:hypothetical protein